MSPHLAPAFSARTVKRERRRQRRVAMERAASRAADRACAESDTLQEVRSIQQRRIAEWRSGALATEAKA